MKEITIEELERIDPSTYYIVDLRPEDQYRRGNFPGSVNIPVEQLSARKMDLPKEKTVYLLCHTGERSQTYTKELEAEGYDAVNVRGGYRAYLKLSLSRYMEKESEEKRRKKTAEIERSIIKKFRKSIWRPFTKALNEYQMIREGDRIAVCISGGKDSMLLAKLVQELKRHGNIPFEAVFLVMNPGYNSKGK